MVEAKEIQKILREFNLKGYADPNSKYIDNGKNGKILTLEIGRYKYEDEYYGGEPYAGNETLWFEGKDIFRCVYWGKVIKGVNFSDIYNFLKTALAKGQEIEMVHRGPKEYIEGNLKYTNSGLIAKVRW
jgi:hypothetical protein